MKCFYHGELEAVATCQRCGKGLCHECAAKRSPCMRDECARIVEEEREAKIVNEENEKKQKYLDALIDTKQEFVRACIVGVVLMAGGFMSQYGTFSILLFFWLFGWKLLTYLQSKVPIFLVGNLLFWLTWVFVKIIASFVFGIPAFIYQLIKTFYVQKKINNLK